MKKRLLQLTLMLGLATSAIYAQDTYVVAGSKAILNPVENGNDYGWDASANENQMTTTDNKTYTLTVEDLTIDKGNYGYKIVKNNGTQWIPEGTGNDKIVTIDDYGKYNITYSYNVETGNINAEITKTQALETVWTVCGSSAELFGETWSPACSANDMVKNNDDGKYYLNKENVQLTAGTIEYKVAANDAWDTNYPAENASFEIPETGKYDVQFVFDAETKDVSATATPKFIDTVVLPAGEYATRYFAEGVSLMESDTDVKFYVVTGVTVESVTLLEVTTKKVPANTPCLVYNAAEAEKTVKLATADDAAPLDAILAPEFKGTAEAKEFEVSETLDYFVCDGENFVFVKDAGTLPAHRCWIELSKNAAAKSLAIVIDGETDGIRSIENGESKINNSGYIYNLAGQRVGNDYKGIVIINGKKVKR